MSDLYKIPFTKIFKYIEENGMDKGYFDQLVKLYVGDPQFVEALENNYCIFDYDSWKHFQKLIGVTISFNRFIEISSLLWEEDIEVMELPYKQGG